MRQHIPFYQFVLATLCILETIPGSLHHSPSHQIHKILEDICSMFPWCQRGCEQLKRPPPGLRLLSLLINVCTVHLLYAHSYGSRYCVGVLLFGGPLFSCFDFRVALKREESYVGMSEIFGFCRPIFPFFFVLINWFCVEFELRNQNPQPASEF